ncbi:MAG: RDD family protein [Acidobacteria bacterium]|nr:RDD family protein [Acidobacteriota bacterium]
MTDNSNVTTRTAQSPNGSTLIEFPGVNRPAWRRELSERFREIQQRRARESDSDGEEAPRRAPSAQTFSAPEETPAAGRAAESATKQLGLVPPPAEPEPNPIVAAALARIERARASAQSQTYARHGSGRAQAAAARVVEEQPEQQLAEAALPTPQPTPLVVVQPKQAPKPEPKPEPTPQASGPEPAAPRAEVVEPEAPTRRAPARAAATEETAAAVTDRRAEVARAKTEAARPASPSPSQTAAVAEPQSGSRQPRHIDGVLDEFWLERQGIELLPKVAERELSYDDRAPRPKRLAAALVDLFAVALFAAPFAAAIELTVSNWGDQRVWGSMALIAALVMFLYHTCSVALAGRTLGMSLCGLQAVDARKASVPTTGQCMRRALVYMLSLATAGLGIIYALFDAEGRTAHDILSGTVVVRK